MTKRVLLLALISAIGSVPLAAQSPAPARWEMPRTADGKPNFEGDWVNNTFTPLERPEELKDKAFFTAEEARAYAERAIARIGAATGMAFREADSLGVAQALVVKKRQDLELRLLRERVLEGASSAGAGIDSALRRMQEASSPPPAPADHRRSRGARDTERGGGTARRVGRQRLKCCIERVQQ